jgi:hypothetical protein
VKPEPLRLARGVLAFLVALAPIVLLAVLAWPGPVTGVVVVGLSAALAVFLGIWRPTRRSDWRVLPVLAAAAYGSVLAPPNPTTALLAGWAGLGILFWLSQDSESVGGMVGAALALVFPGTAVGIAVASALLLPVPEAAVGIAAGLVVSTLVLIAWLYRTPWSGVPAESSGY